MPPTPAPPGPPLLVPPGLSERLRTAAAAEDVPVETLLAAALGDYLASRTGATRTGASRMGASIGGLGQVFATSHAAVLTRLAR